MNDRLETLREDEETTVTRLSNATGEFFRTRHHLFPGVDLVYNDAHIQSCGPIPSGSSRVLEIDHCKEGRLEREWGERYVYLSPGDLSISRRTEADDRLWFPTNHYHGISLLVDVDASPPCMSCFLEDVDVRPASLERKFCGKEPWFVARERPCFQHIFSEMYAVPEAIRKGYLKVKVLELMLFLSGMDPAEAEHPRFSKAQVDLAKRASRYLCAHLDEKVTIQELARMLKVSPTLLKTSFRGVYGMPLYAYVRTMKMQAAAQMLRGYGGTILQVAETYGYENGSKFAKAFRDVMGVEPSAYRDGSVAF
ncbi:MAG: AraC family transcriptional regulator [Sphaerochaeta sp.]|jgi:AraC-like DNA-binding protein|nr:AraC family transcriptional regulator [Sphaerochaeta sp.]MCH3919124.1 AraC family transcriptional regulator [Sphaerochaeta sp.]MCI2046006.1 AraC family transcriptional regulator [Sphaerochaeta sp.]MCI2077053.1 AraC family transcriptional regulator [Sphaerochaeta sp.]MCI2097356.1 AraC family transcriptional regulator [Sphaerochaeta sp.]